MPPVRDWVGHAGADVRLTRWPPNLERDVHVWGLHDSDLQHLIDGGPLQRVEDRRENAEYARLAEFRRPVFEADRIRRCGTSQARPPYSKRANSVLGFSHSTTGARMTTASTTLAEPVDGSAKALGFGIAVLGAVMAVMGFVAPVELGARVAEVTAGALAALGGVLLLMRGRAVARWSGDFALLASLVYLGVTNTEFHEGGVGYSIAVVQFVTVPIVLVLGAMVFALTPEGQGTGRLNDFIPDGVLLVVGTIVLAIGLGQLGNERLMTPKWNWVSFIGLTVSGMLVLIVLRAALKAALGRARPSRGTPRLLGLLGTELLLVGGLGLMIYGALNNLVLGANGFRTGFKGNSEGLVVLIAAALFLIVVRGGFKLATGSERGAARAVVREILYVVGAVAFIVGERSVVSGKPPAVSIGGALPAAAAILLGALLLLVPVRIAAKQGRLQRQHG